MYAAAAAAAAAAMQVIPAKAASFAGAFRKHGCSLHMMSPHAVAPPVVASNAM
jgi:hypothetical protein